MENDKINALLNAYLDLSRCVMRLEDLSSPQPSKVQTQKFNKEIISELKRVLMLIRAAIRK